MPQNPGRMKLTWEDGGGGFVRGLVKFYYDWDWNGAEAEFKKALELNPGYAQAHQYYADFVKSFGRFDEALREMRGSHLDPLSYSITTGM